MSCESSSINDYISVLKTFALICTFTPGLISDSLKCNKVAGRTFPPLSQASGSIKYWNVSRQSVSAKQAKRLFKCCDFVIKERLVANQVTLLLKVFEIS